MTTLNPRQSPRSLNELRTSIRSAYLANESHAISSLLKNLPLSELQRQNASREAADLVAAVRASKKPGFMATFLVEYGLSTQEGVALMCLAEALLRVPDVATIDTLISDKISAADWGRHLGHSSSSLVNASTWALMLTGKLLKQADSSDISATLQKVVQRLGEPVVRTAVEHAIRQIADQFIVGESIESAYKKGKSMTQQGYQYSFDMLGEAALTNNDAKDYYFSYSHSISYLGKFCHSENFRNNPGISIKLSALHPRYEATQRSFVLDEVVETVYSLSLLAKKAGMGLNIDAEESDRLDLSLDVIERVLSESALESWEGFGTVVQAYGPRAAPLIDWLQGLARKLDRKIMVRLVKGAYWDTEIKRAQVLGLPTFPVFSRKVSTDVSYLACAAKLLEANDSIYPQFATHNAHTICSVYEMIDENHDFEFQKLHGMGEEIHEVARNRFGHRCRIYAPVGDHEDLLAYLVRRILENGANSSFLNQLEDLSVPVKEIVADPVASVITLGKNIPNPAIKQPDAIFGRGRVNSRGLDLSDEMAVTELKRGMEHFRDYRWTAKPTDFTGTANSAETVRNPAVPEEIVGAVVQTTEDFIDTAIKRALTGFLQCSQSPAVSRAELLNDIASSYELHSSELIALMVRETGKTIADAISEVREAVDFCRFYANEAIRLDSQPGHQARGVVVCISPWNFPLAIFTGQIAAAIAAGNSVIAKPAEQSPLIGARATELMHQAGASPTVLQLLPGRGETVGALLVADPRIAGVLFTGSTSVAQAIHRSMATDGNPAAPLIAETGGLNAMIVDSTALPEQAIRDILDSSFQSAGQRCSALRVLYIQKEIETRFHDMLFGAMDQLQLGNPWNISTDIGPVIDRDAQFKLNSYCETMTQQDRLLYQVGPPDGPGYYVAPKVFSVSGIEELESEVFGPVLHLATYESANLSSVIDSINKSGYGLTFGLHTRVDQRVQSVFDRMRAGNIYVNRNQIGAVVGSQPFGGCGLSGTGPKAGGYHYVSRLREFTADKKSSVINYKDLKTGDLKAELQYLEKLWLKWSQQEDRVSILDSILSCTDEYDCTMQVIRDFDMNTVDLDGPTGESNRLSYHPKGVYVCIGSMHQALCAVATGNAALVIGVGKNLVKMLREANVPILYSDVTPDSNSLREFQALQGVSIIGADSNCTRELRKELAGRDGPVIQLITETDVPWQFVLEKTMCVDTTAAGGNASLFLESE